MSKLVLTIALKMKLSELKSGKPAIVDHVESSQAKAALVKRLAAMGIVPDQPIQVLRKAWFGGPLHIRVGSITEIAIRRQEAKMVEVRYL
jgi:ferrous iron transport protein A